MKTVPAVVRFKKRLSNNPNVNLVDMSIPLKSQESIPSLKDVLEMEVASKYYLTNEIIEKLVRESEGKELVSIKVNKR